MRPRDQGESEQRSAEKCARVVTVTARAVVAEYGESDQHGGYHLDPREDAARRNFYDCLAEQWNIKHGLPHLAQCEVKREDYCYVAGKKYEDANRRANDPFPPDARNSFLANERGRESPRQLFAGAGRTVARSFKTSGRTRDNTLWRRHRIGPAGSS
jgi:hypothetical protein